MWGTSFSLSQRTHFYPSASYLYSLLLIIYVGFCLCVGGTYTDLWACMSSDSSTLGIFLYCFLLSYPETLFFMIWGLGTHLSLSPNAGVTVMGSHTHLFSWVLKIWIQVLMLRLNMPVPWMRHWFTESIESLLCMKCRIKVKIRYRLDWKMNQET